MHCKSSNCGFLHLSPIWVIISEEYHRLVEPCILLFLASQPTSYHLGTTNWSSQDIFLSFRLTLQRQCSAALGCTKIGSNWKKDVLLVFFLDCSLFKRTCLSLLNAQPEWKPLFLCVLTVNYSYYLFSIDISRWGANLNENLIKIAEPIGEALRFHVRLHLLRGWRKKEREVSETVFDQWEAIGVQRSGLSGIRHTLGPTSVSQRG